MRAPRDDVRGLTALHHVLVKLVLKHRHWQHADPVLDERRGLRGARAAENPALRLLAEVDGSRHLREPGADVVRVGLDFAAHAAEEFARAHMPVIDDNLRGGFDRRPLAADDGRGHDRLVDAGRAAFGASDKAPLALLLVSGAVGKPAVERVSVSAGEGVFDHPLPPASSPSSSPAASSACKSSQPPTCVSPTKICGTVHRPFALAAIAAWAARSPSTPISSKDAALARNSALAEWQ